MILFALPILVLLVAIAIILLAFRRWKLASVLVVVVLMLNWYWQVCPMHIFASEEPTSKTFRVVTYNIYPQVDSTQYEQWQQQMLEEIKFLHPDVICLQELGPNMKWLEMELCKYFCYTEDELLEYRLIRRRLYSRYPMSNIKVYHPELELDTSNIDTTFRKSIQIHRTFQPYWSAEVHLPGRDTVTVFSCHLQSNGYSTIRRSMKIDEPWLNGFNRYRVAIKSAEELRKWEARNLRNVLDSIGNDHPIVIAGDFNDFNKSECLNTIQGKDILDAWWTAGRGLGFTFSCFNLFLRLDHVLYNNRLVLNNIEIRHIGLSDHRPLIADFYIK